MFKFMKSKKGFTLVELMIVVVIMAILVAVAVPIFNSVTGKAREKTCIDNQRQLMTTLTNLFMAYGISGTDDEVKIECSATAIEVVEGDLSEFSLSKITTDDIKSSFKTPPVCGDENNTITAILQPNPDGTVIVSTSCSGGHELEQTS